MLLSLRASPELQPSLVLTLRCSKEEGQWGGRGMSLCFRTTERLTPGQQKLMAGSSCLLGSGVS